MSIALMPAWGYSTTRSVWRSGARAELGDTTTPYLWSDALLHAWLAEAIGDFARLFPREETIALTSVAGQASYDLLARALQQPRRVPAKPRRVHAKPPRRVLDSRHLD